MPNSLVKDVMTPSLIQIRQDQHIYDALALFDMRKISGMVVSDQHGKRSLGVLSKTDIAGPKLIEYLTRYETLQNALVSDFMNPIDPITVDENAKLEDAINIMIDKKIHRVFVTDKSGEMTGILTTIDVLKNMPN